MQIAPLAYYNTDHHFGVVSVLFLQYTHTRITFIKELEGPTICSRPSSAYLLIEDAYTDERPILHAC